MASPPKLYFWCEDCGGSGKKPDGMPCAGCKGSGRVVVWATGRRQFLRHLTKLPITVSLRKRNIKGTCNQIAEGGLGAHLRQAVPVGSTVSLQLPVPPQPGKLSLKGVVRYESGLQHGLEFVSLTEAERKALRHYCSGLPSVKL